MNIVLFYSSLFIGLITIINILKSDSEQVVNWSEFTKSIIRLIPMFIIATIAIGIKLMIESRRKKITFITALLSWFSAVGTCYLFYEPIVKHINQEYRALAFAFVVMIGDKLMVYIVEKFDVDIMIQAGLNRIFSKKE